MSEDKFPEVPVSTVQIGASPVQYKNQKPISENLGSYIDPNKKTYILYECKQDELEELYTENEVFEEPVIYEETSNECPPEAFDVPDIGAIGELEVAVQSNSQEHTYQNSKKPMHAPTGKYHIMELFWFLNPRYISDQDSIPLSQAEFCTISLNIDYGNMKITFYKVPNGAIEGHKVYLMACQRMTSVSIYPSSLFKLIRSNRDFSRSPAIEGDNKPITISCMEQLIFKTNESWQQERPLAIFKIGLSIELHIQDPKYGNFHYIFQNWQKEALIHAANFVVNQGLLLTGQNIVAGNRV